MRKFFFVVGMLVVVVAVYLTMNFVSRKVPEPTDHQVSEAYVNQLVSNRIHFMETGALKNTLTSESFEITQVRKMLDNPDAARFVIQYGAHDNGVQCAIIYCIDKDWNRLETFLEIAMGCPPNCDDDLTAR